MKKKLGLAVLGVYAFACAMLLFGQDAKAYIDPSVMTYLIQAIAGVAIAVGAGIGLYFRKAKKKLGDKLGIEETKEMESDDIVVKTDKNTKA